MKPHVGTFILALVSLVLLPLQASGQANLPWEEYDKLINASTTVEPRDTDLFGDQVNLYNTGLSFSVTDISLPGNNELPVALTRTFSVKSRKSSGDKDLPMATWDLDLPRLEGVFAANAIGLDPVWPNDRCEGNGKPPSVTVQGGNTYGYDQYWHGNHAHMPGGGEIILANQGAEKPSGDWKWMTSDFTYFRCLTSIQNGPGEGFLAITADGTRYWFNRLAQYHEEPLRNPETSDGPPDGEIPDPPDDDPPDDDPPEDDPPDDESRSAAGAGHLERRRNVLYATRVEDRFGNWVEYTFTNDYDEPARLELIESSDEREIKLTYDAQGRVHKACDRDVPNCDGVDTNTWTYQYGTSGDLIGVHLPDGSAWTINFGGLWDVEIEYSNEPNTPRWCALTAPFLSLRNGTGTVTHPSGAIGEFEVQRVLHGRSNVPKACINGTFDPPHYTNDDIAVWPRQYDLVGIKEKRISGPGLPAMKWTFSTGHQTSWTQGSRGPGCANKPDLHPCDDRDWPGCSSQKGCGEPECLDDSCAGVATTTVSTTVSGTDTEWTRYTFGNSYRYNEGKLLKVERGTTGPNDILRTEEMEYELAHAGTSFPVPIGDASHNNRGNVFAAAYLAPLKQRTIIQQSTDFTWQADSFDEYARPLQVTRFNSQGENRVELTAYHDNRFRWVLGQIASLTVGATAPVEVAEQTTYDGTWAVPLVSTRFGKTVQTLGWDTTSSPESGQLGTVRTHRDGNNNTTMLTNWKRGIPQTINYADSESASAVVNNNGTVASVTDENGYKTCYAYDGLGRLTQITYPSESQSGVCDTSTWNRTTQTFVQSTSSIYGIGPGHWRQTVSTGNGHRITYFDALWRPLLVHEYDGTDSASQIATRRFSRFEYDHEGRTTFTSYPSTSSSASTGTHTYYDVLGRVTAVVQDSELGPLTTTTEYLKNSVGYHTKVTDPRNYVTRTWYQAFDEPDYGTPLAISHPEDVATVFGRDFLGQPNVMWRQLFESSQFDQLDMGQLQNLRGSALATREYVYNSYRELCKFVEPETSATIMAYDGAGNLKWSKPGSTATSANHCNVNNGNAPNPPSSPPAESIKREYDNRNRIIELKFPDGRGDTYYEYLPDGELGKLSAFHDNFTEVVTDYEYNHRRMLTREDLSMSQFNLVNSVSHNYNANGHLSSSHYTWPQTHILSVDFAPNALGQPTRAGDFATNVSYHPNGALKQFTYGNGIVHTLTQNARNLPDTSTDAYGGTKFLADGYDYDANGNVAAISDGATGTNQQGNRTMSYDGLDRLTGVTSPMFGTATYAYNELNNLTRVKLTSGTNVRDHYMCYAGNTNRLTSLRTGSCSGGVVMSFSYDAQGNLASKGGSTFDFDYGNRLREVVSSQSSGYAYDGHGRRVARSVFGMGLAELATYSSDGRLIWSVNLFTHPNIQKSNRYVYLGSSLIAIHEREGGAFAFKYQHTDALGSPVVVTDDNRTVLERREYEPYGMQLQPTPQDGPGFTGHVYDAATGLNYMQQRYYDPAIGRFISADPVGADPNTGANFNRYWYANNNPYKFTDPDGRESVGILAFERDQQALLNGEISEEEFIRNNQMRGTGAIEGASFWVGGRGSVRLANFFGKAAISLRASRGFTQAERYIRATTKGLARTGGRSKRRTLQSDGIGGEKGASRLFNKLTKGESVPTRNGGRLGSLGDGSRVHISRRTLQDGTTETSVRISQRRTGSRIEDRIKVRFKEEEIR